MTFRADPISVIHFQLQAPPEMWGSEVWPALKVIALGMNGANNCSFFKKNPIFNISYKILRAIKVT
jgi:hypothetical protein